MQGIAMETEKESSFVLSIELCPRYLCGADYRNAVLSAFWVETGCSGRQNETPLFRSAAQERRFFFCRIQILSFFCRLFLSFKERKTAVLVENWRPFRGQMAVADRAKKRPARRQPLRQWQGSCSLLSQRTTKVDGEKNGRLG